MESQSENAEVRKVGKDSMQCRLLWVQGKISAGDSFSHVCLSFFSNAFPKEHPHMWVPSSTYLYSPPQIASSVYEYSQLSLPFKGKSEKKPTCVQGAASVSLKWRLLRVDQYEHGDSLCSMELHSALKTIYTWWQGAWGWWLPRWTSLSSLDMLILKAMRRCFTNNNSKLEFNPSMPTGLRVPKSPLRQSIRIEGHRRRTHLSSWNPGKERPKGIEDCS